MATTGRYTIREILTQALWKIGVVGIGNEPTDEEMSVAEFAFNAMMKSWQNDGLNLWGVASQTLTLTTAAVYTLNPVRPVEILNANLKRGSIETPMIRLTRNEYDRLPLKTATGLPTQYYYDRQKEDARFYVWPVLAVANGESVVITYQREFDDQTDINDYPDLPGEFWEAAVYGLAARLADDFMIKDARNVIARAEILYDKALAYDREGSVFFAGPWAG